MFPGGRNPRVTRSGRDREKRKGERHRLCGVGETREGLLESYPEELKSHAL